MSRKKNTKFLEIGLNIGDIIYFKYNNYFAKISDNNKVEYNGEIYSLSLLTRKLTGEIGLTPNFTNGYLHWQYNGERLYDRLLRFEKEIFIKELQKLHPKG